MNGSRKPADKPSKQGKVSLLVGSLVDGWKELTDSASNSLTLLVAIIHCVQEMNPTVDTRQPVLDCRRRATV